LEETAPVPKFFSAHSFHSKIQINSLKMEKNCRKLESIVHCRKDYCTLLEEGSIANWKLLEKNSIVDWRQDYWQLLEEGSIVNYKLLEERSIMDCRQEYIGGREYSIL